MNNTLRNILTMAATMDAIDFFSAITTPSTARDILFPENPVDAECREAITGVISAKMVEWVFTEIAAQADILPPAVATASVIAAVQDALQQRLGKGGVATLMTMAAPTIAEKANLLVFTTVLSVSHSLGITDDRSAFVSMTTHVGHFATEAEADARFSEVDDDKPINGGG